MNELKIFENEEFGKIRTTEENGKVLFCGSDVANALGYIDTPKAIKTHCKNDGWVICPVTDSLGRIQKAKFIDEGNLYRMITHSKLPSAEKFEKWVFDEVLPTIRRHGMYAIDDLIENPDLGIKALMALKEERAKVAKLKSENEYLEKTKAWISDKKTATAMNTASQKSKEVKKLKIELDRSKEYASIKAMEKVTKAKFKWQPMRNYCTSHELEMKKIFDPNFGAVNTYPAEAWKEVYGIDLDVFF